MGKSKKDGSESSQAGDRKKCLAAGCDDYIPKPISAARLQEILADYLTP